MFYMFGMLKFQVPEAEVIYLVNFFIVKLMRSVIFSIKLLCMYTVSQKKRVNFETV